jgi:hypothetical protein
MKRGRKMKKLSKVVVTVAVIAVVAIMAKNTVVANAEAINKEETVNVVINDTREETDVEETKETVDGLITFRLMVDKIEYLSFRKGHDGEHTLEYSINGGPKNTVVMGVLGLELFNYMPTYVSHFYDIENVRIGDVITYSYSYYNTYFQQKEPNVVKGTQVVDKAYIPSENE